MKMGCSSWAGKGSASVEEEELSIKNIIFERLIFRYANPTALDNNRAATKKRRDEGVCGREDFQPNRTMQTVQQSCSIGTTVSNMNEQ
jgi:hypothetical protein